MSVTVCLLALTVQVFTPAYERPEIRAGERKRATLRSQPLCTLRLATIGYMRSRWPTRINSQAKQCHAPGNQEDAGICGREGRC